MNLTEIINSTTMEPTEQLERIVEIIARARKAYGNDTVVIKTPTVGTVDGGMDLGLLSVEDKVALAKQEIRLTRMKAIEATKATDGAVIGKEWERLLAVNSTLVNLTETVDLGY